MRLYPLLVVLLMLLLPAMAVAANNSTNMTQVSEYQNASVYVNRSTDTMMAVGIVDNATVYRSGGGNVTIMDHAVKVDLGSAPEMGYRDVYLFLRLPGTFENVTFDYDFSRGEKSNVLLVDFATALPKTGIPKGGVPDHAALGLGTWSAVYGEIGGLKPLQQGSHHVEIGSNGNQLALRVDGKGLTVEQYNQHEYMVIHLMTGDGDSYLRGTVSNISYAGPPLSALTPSSKATVVPPFNITPTTLPRSTSTGIPAIQVNATESPASPTTTIPQGRLLSGVNIIFAISAAIVFFCAWAIVYYRYINK